MPQSNRPHVDRKHTNLPAKKVKNSVAQAKVVDPRRLLQRAYVDPTTLTPTDVQHLQRAVGNRATINLMSSAIGLQPKLKLGPAGDKYEREADQVAQQVVQHTDRPEPVQRTDDEDELAQAKRPGESDNLLRQTVSLPPRATPFASRISRVQRAPTRQLQPSFSLQRQPGEEEELAQTKLLHGPEGGAVEKSVEQQIQAARGGGKALDKGTLSSMEQGFGANFGSVRVHTGGQADTLNRSLNSRAFTVGSDIFFRSGEYNPGSSGGKQLLAHELTHTVQQSGGGVQRDMIQRAIGFEFEFGTWQTTKLVGKKKKRLEKGEEILAGDGFKVEGEDVDANTSAIEIVTKPYSNVEEAVKSVRQAQKWMKKVYAAGTVANRTEDDPNAEPATQETKKEVRANKFQGKNGVRITPGSDKGKMQASPAIALDRMSALFQKAGGGYKKTTDDVAALLNSDDIKHEYLNDADASAELIGLVTLLVDYISQGAYKTVELSYPKAAVRVMARTSFTKMFKLVPEYDFFSHPDNVDKWVDLVLKAALQHPQLGKEMVMPQFVTTQVRKKKWWGKKYTKDVTTLQPGGQRNRTVDEIRNEAVLGMPLNAMEAMPGDQQGTKYKLNLTRDDWLRSMATEDKLSKAKDKRFEGMGAYGDAVDVEVLEDLAEDATERSVSQSGIDDISENSSHSDDGSERSDESGEGEEARAPKQAPLFELRGLKDMFDISQDVTLDKWITKVKKVFTIIDDVNQQSFKPGGKPTVPADVNDPGGWTRL